MKRIAEWLSAAGGAVLAFVTGLPVIIWILIGVMSLDYITGIICGCMGKSTKTENGGLSSQAATVGIMKKMIVLVVVGMAALVDLAISHTADIEFVAVTGACCLWFIASEGMSVLENAAAMGVPIPKILLQALELFKDKGGEVPDKK